MGGKFNYKPYESLIYRRWLEGVPSRKIAQEIGPQALASTVRIIARRMGLPMRETSSNNPNLFKEMELDKPSSEPPEGDIIPINSRGHYADAKSASIILKALERNSK